MTTAAEPRQFTESLGKGAIWIHGELITPVTGVQGPLVMSADWMLEMVRMNNGVRTIGLFLASFGIITFEIPEFSAVGKADFVGLSLPGKAPAWFQTSMVFDLGNVPLATSPAELLRVFANPLPGTTIEVAPAASPLSRRAKQRICETYREDVPLSEIARSLGVSHAHLTRQFKRDFGFTPIDYRHRLRVSDAMGRLSKGDDILDVGHDVGFNDTSRFYQNFRKVTGTSPGKCRL